MNRVEKAELAVLALIVFALVVHWGTK